MYRVRLVFAVLLTAIVLSTQVCANGSFTEVLTQPFVGVFASTFGIGEKCRKVTKTKRRFKLCSSFLQIVDYRLSTEGLCAELTIDSPIPSLQLEACQSSKTSFSCTLPPGTSSCPSKKSCISECRQHFSCSSIKKENSEALLDNLAQYIDDIPSEIQKQLGASLITRKIKSAKTRSFLVQMLKGACKFSSKRCKKQCRKSIRRCRKTCNKLSTPPSTPSLVPTVSASASPSSTSEILEIPSSPSISSSPLRDESLSITPIASLSLSMSPSSSTASTLPSPSFSASLLASASSSSSASPSLSSLSIIPSAPVSSTPSTSASTSSTPTLSPSSSSSMLMTISPSFSPSAFSTSSPSASTTVSNFIPSSPSPTPDIPTESFNLLTNVEGGMSLSEFGQLPTTEGSSVQGQYNFTTIEEGIISLDAVANGIDTIRCYRNNSIQIKIKEQYKGVDSLSLSDMYPTGSVLYVNFEIFGICDLDNFQSSVSSTALNNQDGFLKVSMVSGTVRDHLISGTPVGYLDMFSDFDMEIDSLEDDSGVVSRSLEFEKMIQVSQSESSTLNTAERVKDAISLSVTLKEFEYVNITATGKVSWDVSGKRVKAKKSRSRVGFSAILSAGVKVEAALIINILPFSWEREKLFRFFSLPIYGFSIKIPFLPRIRFGFFLDIPVSISGKAKMEFNQNLKIPSNFNIDTGIKEFVVSFGNDGGSDSSTTTLARNEPDSTTTKYKDASNIVSYIPNKEYSFTGFLGVRPTIIFDASIATIGAHFYAGLQLEVKLKAPIPYKALEPESSYFQNEYCDFCHYIQASIQAKVDRLTLALEVAKKTFAQNFGSLKYSRTLAQLCLAPLPSDNPICTPSPTISPSISSSVSPTPIEPETTTPEPSVSVSPSAGDPSETDVCRDRPTLSLGSGSAEAGRLDEKSSVEGLQALLNENNARLVVDGIFGKKTEDAVRNYQKSQGITADGIVGAETWKKLCEPKDACTKRPILSKGSGDPATGKSDQKEYVKDLQNMLNENGAKLTVDGIFGSETENAVKSYQESQGLSVDGIVGPDTWQKLCDLPTACATKPRLSKGSGDPETGKGDQRQFVKDLQGLLNRSGAKLVVDGIFGSETENAVKSYQRSQGLSIDGIVGPNTWDILCMRNN